MTKKLKRLVLTAGVVATLLSSCHNPVFDYEGDCEVKYRIRFVYDMNLKWADAFPSEVKTVNLYAYDSNGKFYKEFRGEGQALSEPGYTIELDLPAGDYTFIAWCGLRTGEESEESFTVAAPQKSVSELSELTCSLNTLKDAEEMLYSNGQLKFMYHGKIEANLPDSQDGAEYLYTMPLTKDTNHIRIILQQLSAVDMDPSQYGFSITDTNTLLGYDNSLLSNEEVKYLPWDIITGEAGVGKEGANGNTGLVYVDGVIADLSVSRLMAEHEDDVMLTITDKTDGRVIACVPLIHYALLSKEYYEMAYGHSMSDQEFLDREDEYILTFFLDENNNWINSYVLIHSWRIVLQNYEV